MILPGFIEKTMAMLQKYPEAALCSILSLLLGEKGENLKIREEPQI